MGEAQGATGSAGVGLADLTRWCPQDRVGEHNMTPIIVGLMVDMSIDTGIITNIYKQYFCINISTAKHIEMEVMFTNLANGLGTTL